MRWYPSFIDFYYTYLEQMSSNLRGRAHPIYALVN
jgi:hypothetical protein